MSKFLRITCVIAALAVVGAIVAQNRAQSHTQTSGQSAKATSSSSARSSHDGNAFSNGGGNVGPWRDPSKEVYVIIYSPGPAWKQGRTFYEQDLADHTQYLSNLQQSNVLLLAGPFKDNSGAEAVIQVKDETEAMLVVGRDPAVNRRVMDAQLKPWHLAFENTGRSTFGDNGRFNRGSGGGPAVTSSSRSGGG